MNQLFLAILLSIAPLSELRGGIPVAIDYAIKNNLPALPFIMLIILANIIIIFPVFFFLDKIHANLLKIKGYERFYKSYIKIIQNRVDKFERNYAVYGFLALMIFVAIPIPTTGAWTGTIISWLLGLERRKSIAAIVLGVIFAGVIVSLTSLGIFKLVLG